MGTKRLYYTLFKYLLVRPWIVLFWRPWVEGAENLPDTGPAILASNHISLGDSLVLPAMVPRRMTFPAKAEAFDGHGKGPKDKIIAWFLRVVGMRPMDRSGGRASANSLGAVSSVLAEGGLLGIYPEGTRSPDGRLYRGKTGAARLALADRAPIIPVAMLNTELHRGPFGIPMMRRPGVRIGKPLDFTSYADQATNGRVLRYVTDEIVAAIGELSGQTYVDVYASTIKSGNYAGDVAAKVMPRPGANATPPPLDSGE